MLQGHSQGQLHTGEERREYFYTTLFMDDLNKYNEMNGVYAPCAHICS